MQHHSSRRALRRGTLLLLFVFITTLLGACGAEQPKVYRIGVLSGLEFIDAITDSFKAKMTEMGYVEGKNVVYDVQKTNFDMEAYRRILQKFVDDKVDLIVTYPTEASLEAKNITRGTGIPVVFTFALIEGVNLVDNIRAPGENITGVRYPGPDVALKRFELMRAIAPNAKRILLPYQRDYPIVPSQLEILRPVAQAGGVTLIEMPASNAEELKGLLEAQSGGDTPVADAIVFLVEPLTVTPGTLSVMGAYAAKYTLPIGGALLSEGGYETLFGVNVDFGEAGSQAALLVDKIFKGTPAGSIPVVSAETFMQINYRAAQAAGIQIPEGLLSQADEIIR